MWFTDAGSTPAIGRITPSGTITEFSAGLQPGNASVPAGIAAGPDGNMWFTDEAGTPAIGRITPSGTITEFSAGLQPGNASVPARIAAGPDGNMWFTDEAGTKAIGRITLSGTITEFSAGLQAGNASFPADIVAGPDGNLWFTDNGGTRTIGRITPTGTITEFSDGLQAGNASFLVSIAAGPDGNLWFTDNGGTRTIGRITPTGTITEFSDGLQAGNASVTFSIVPGPDGNLWFVDHSGTRAIGRIGVGAPAASVRAPSVTGSDQQGTQHVCQGDVWAQWAGQPPSYGAFPFDGYQWLRDGSPIAGAATQQYTPTARDVGHQLSCVLTVSYQLLGVTVSATSARVPVFPQAAGPQGPPGARGPQGAPGNVELVTCKTVTTTVLKKVGGKRRKVHVKRQVCTARLVSGAVRFSTAGAIRASLRRGGVTAATGIAVRAGSGLRLLLRSRGRLQPGRYTLHLAHHKSTRVTVN